MDHTESIWNYRVEEFGGDYPVAGFGKWAQEPDTKAVRTSDVIRTHTRCHRIRRDEKANSLVEQNKHQI